MAAKILLLLVKDADHVLEMLPDAGLSGTRMEDAPEGQVVKIVATGDDTAETLWFEFSWHADKLGIISGRYVDETPPEPELPNIGDTCCGKCPGATCYVDFLTGERD